MPELIVRIAAWVIVLGCVVACFVDHLKGVPDDLVHLGHNPPDVGGNVDMEG